MEQRKQQRIRALTDRLNRCRYEYYNLNAPTLTDAEYDALFDELGALEKETGFNLTNSPTQTVSFLQKIFIAQTGYHFIAVDVSMYRPSGDGEKVLRQSALSIR